MKFAKILMKLLPLILCLLFLVDMASCNQRRKKQDKQEFMARVLKSRAYAFFKGFVWGIRNETSYGTTECVPRDWVELGKIPGKTSEAITINKMNVTSIKGEMFAAVVEALWDIICMEKSDGPEVSTTVTDATSEPDVQKQAEEEVNATPLAIPEAAPTAAATSFVEGKIKITRSRSRMAKRHTKRGEIGKRILFFFKKALRVVYAVLGKAIQNIFKSPLVYQLIEKIKCMSTLADTANEVKAIIMNVHKQFNTLTMLFKTNLKGALIHLLNMVLELMCKYRDFIHAIDIARVAWHEKDPKEKFLRWGQFFGAMARAIGKPGKGAGIPYKKASELKTSLRRYH